MADYLYQTMKYEDFIVKAKDNGWVLTPEDEKTMHDLWSAVWTETGVTESEKIDDFLRTVAGQDGWHKGYRDRMIKGVRRIVDDAYKKFEDPEHRKGMNGDLYLAHLRDASKNFFANRTQEDLDKAYKGRFNKERPLSVEEQKTAEANRIFESKVKREREEQERQKNRPKEMQAEIAKREEEKRLREEKWERERKERDAYNKQADENEKKFNEQVGIVTDDYLNKVQENGWIHKPHYGKHEWDDRSLMNRLLRVAKDTMDQRIISLLGKLMTTDANTPESRKEMCEQILTTVKEVRADEKVHITDRKDLEVIERDLKPELTPKERQADAKAYKEVKEKARKEQELKEKRAREKAEREKAREEAKAKEKRDTEDFKKTLYGNGWSKSDEGLLDTIWLTYKKSLGSKKTSPLDETMWDIMQNPLDPKAPVTSRNEKLLKLRSVAVKKNINDWLKLSNAIDKAIDDKHKEADNELTDAKKVRDKKTNEKIADIASNFDRKPTEKAKEAEDAEIKKPSFDKKAPMEKTNPEILTQEYAKREAATLMRELKKVDFNLFGQGSNEFKEMKKSIQELVDYANGQSVREHPDNPNSKRKHEFDPDKYYQRKQEAIDRIQEYLDYKQGQLNRERGRRNDPKRQKHEQPRIHTALRLLNTLENSCAEAEIASLNAKDQNGVSAVDKMAAYERDIREQIAKEWEFRSKIPMDKLIAEAKAYNEAKAKDPNAKVKSPLMDEYTKSMAVTLDCMDKLNGRNFQPYGNEDFLDFKGRAKGLEYKKPETDKKRESLAKNNSKICAAFRNQFRADVASGKEPHMVTNRELMQKTREADKNYVNLADVNLFKLSSRKQMNGKEIDERGQEHLYSDTTKDMITSGNLSKASEDIHVNSALEERKQNIKEKIEQIAAEILGEAKDPKDIVSNLINTYVKNIFLNILEAAGTKEANPYDLSLNEMEKAIDDHSLEKVFKKKVDAYEATQRDEIALAAKENEGNWIEAFAKKEAKADANRDRFMRKNDEQYKEFVKKESENSIQKWDGAQFRMDLWKAELEAGETKKTEQFVANIVNAIDGAAFNPKDPHHEDAFNQLCESMAVVGMRRLLQNAIDRTDASGVQLAMRPDIKGFIATAIYNGLKNDPAFAVRNMAEKMVDDPNYMREKCLSYVDEYEKARKKNLDARKKQKNAVKNDAAKKKQEQKKVKDDSVLKPRVAGR